MYMFNFPIFLYLIFYWAIFYSQLINTASAVQADMGNADLQNSYESFNNVLQTFSNNVTVDYTSIRSDPFNLEQFTTFIDNVSPESHPDLFSESDEKAYWINVYNALAIKTIIDNPDVSSIREISWGMGAFWRNKIVVGGKKMTLNRIEHKILRRKYQDPRIHFAINCASNSCPPIGNRILTGNDLDGQLDKKTYDFINDPSNVRIDHINKEIHLSRIFKWYKKDFIQGHGDLLSYIVDYLDDISTKQEENIVNAYQIFYNKYDWSLNE